MNDAKPIIRCDGNDRPDDIAISNVSLFRLGCEYETREQEPSQ